MISNLFSLAKFSAFVFIFMILIGFSGKANAVQPLSALDGMSVHVSLVNGSVANFIMSWNGVSGPGAILQGNDNATGIQLRLDNTYGGIGVTGISGSNPNLWHLINPAPSNLQSIVLDLTAQNSIMSSYVWVDDVEITTAAGVGTSVLTLNFYNMVGGGSYFAVDTIAGAIVVAPEPMTYLLLTSFLGAAALLRRRTASFR